MESLFIQMMYKSQFWKIDPYDWFCGPGSHLASNWYPVINLYRRWSKINHAYESILLICAYWWKRNFWRNVKINCPNNRAVQIIECDDHVHLVSKAGSVVSSKSPSRAFRWSSIYYTEFTEKLRNITFIIAGDTSPIMNTILRSLSVRMIIAFDYLHSPTK